MVLKKLGRYDIVQVLGRGAMGTVYEARDPNLDRRVAIKTIAVHGIAPEAMDEYESRFRTEARSAARLQHPNIVSVYDSGRDGEVPYLVMEYVEGEDLKHHLDQGNTFSLQQTVAIMRNLLNALGYAHAQNIVHRDVKPANLLMEADGRIKLADFGVARIQDSGEGTRTRGSMVGTLKYMSPEQLQGQTVDARSDLFSAGVVLYQLLTARQPFTADNEFAIIAQIIGVDPEPPSTLQPGLSPAIDAVVAKALARVPDERYATAAEFLDALEEASVQVPDLSTAPAPLVIDLDSDSGLQRFGTTGPGGTLAMTAVSQELELLYWKDVRDSDDIADLQGFLERFPQGIYAQLARKRLRKLGVEVAGETTATMFEPRSLVPMPTTEASSPVAAAPPLQPVASSKPVAPPEPAAVLPPATSTPPAAGKLQATPNDQPVAASVPSPSKGRFAAMSAAALLLAIGAAWWMFGNEPESVPVQADALTTPPLPRNEQPSTQIQSQIPTPAQAPAQAPAQPAPVGGSASTIAPKEVTSPAAGDAGIGARAAASAALPARASASSPKSSTGATVAAVIKKDEALRQSEPAGRAAAPPQPKPAANDLPASTQSGKAQAERSADTSPERACTGRVLIGLQICLNEQCAKPAFAGTAFCAQRRAAEQARQSQQTERN